VALLLDVSGSVANILDVEKAAAERFFSEVLRPDDKALLVGFAQLIAVWQDLTPSVAKLKSALERAGPFVIDDAQRLETHPRGGTLLYDAVNLVATNKLRRLPGRKTIVLITDGMDNGSALSLARAVEAAQQADAVVYGIHFEDEGQPFHTDRGRKVLEDMSGPTGGRTFHVGGKTTLESIFDAIGEEMRNQYGLGYKPPGSVKDGAFHKLEVKTTRSGLKAQAKNGYYAVKK